MKRKYGVLIILSLAVSLLLTAAFYFMPSMPAAVASVSVAEQGQSSGETYVFTRDESKKLFAALQGSVEKELPEDITAAYDMTLTYKIPFTRRYEIYVTSDREIYLKRFGNDRFIRSGSASFFYTHDVFQSLYQFGQMPDVRITVQEEEIFPRILNRRWQFLKWDNNWYDGRLAPAEESFDNGPVLNSAESGLALEVEPVPDTVSLRVTDSAGKAVFDGILTGGQLPVFRRNGFYDYRLSLAWQDEDQPYRGQYEASFSVIMELPPVFEVPETIVQGELAACYARHIPQGIRPVLETDLNYRLKFFPCEDGYIAYLPSHYGTAPGEHRLVYGLEGEALKESTLVVLPWDFHIQYLNVNAGIVASTRNEAAYEQFNRYFPKARETSADERYYTEPFLLPVSGRLTTEFGQTRYVNNEPTSYRHSGLDIAAPIGTPVLAANNGRVTLAMDLILTGNTVVIDHGQGLFSVYYHMHELFAEEGQAVKRGETIGAVGSTGFSTGPHLHFIMSYFTHNLEPGYFLVGEPITFDNARIHLQGQ